VTELREALLRVAVALKQREVPFAVAGGYAAWARGGPEPDHDADLIIDATHVDAARAGLAEAGLRVEDPPEDWLFKVFCDDAMVDLIFAMHGREVDDYLLDRSSPVEVQSVSMPVLSATDVVITKLLALQEHLCDFTRVLPTVRALREQVDWTEVRREVSGHPIAEAFLFLSDRLGISADRRADLDSH
jgi:hypothetical protein